MKRCWLWWSTGKDSAWALHRLDADPDIRVEALVTTVDRESGRVSVHGTRRSILEAQAAATGRPLRTLSIPWPCSNEDYERAVDSLLADARSEGIDVMAFGDLFLEDVRRYREGLIDGSGIEPLFPIWGRDTALLAREMVDAGIRAYLSCLDPEQLEPSFIARSFDHDLLEDLPATVDPCGERGEFHTVAFDGPMFSQGLHLVYGESLRRDGFIYGDFELGSA